jgi:hypothetical protein
MIPPEKYAIATPSFHGDRDRCVQLCRSIDQYVSGWDRHYLLIEDRDLPLFADLAGGRREIILESELLPQWLQVYQMPGAFGGRRVWSGAGALRRGVPPLRGWHAQQLRKMALSRHIDQDVVLFADSDTLFVRPFAMTSLSDSGGTRFYRLDAAVDASMRDHVRWHRTTRAILETEAVDLPGPDYIAHLVVWRTRSAAAMLNYIEQKSGRDWISAVAKHRQFSEYMLYGRFVDCVLTPAASGHTVVGAALAKSYWSRASLPKPGTLRLAQELRDDQVAVGIQSFLNESLAELATTTA